MQVQDPVYNDAEHKFNTGNDQRAGRTFCGKALFFHPFAADAVNEDHAHTARQRHGGVRVAAPEHLERRIGAASENENQAVFLHLDRVSFLDFCLCSAAPETIALIFCIRCVRRKTVLRGVSQAVFLSMRSFARVIAGGEKRTPAKKRQQKHNEFASKCGCPGLYKTPESVYNRSR